MAGLTPVHWKRFEKFLLYIGCTFTRQKGDHRIYWRKGLLRPVVVPQDAQVAVIVIRSNLRTLNISVEEYLEILSDI